MLTVKGESYETQAMGQQGKGKIVLEGLKGKPISQICNENQIRQAQYYQWRERFVSNLDQVFERPKKGKSRHVLSKKTEN